MHSNDADHTTSQSTLCTLNHASSVCAQLYHEEDERWDKDCTGVLDDVMTAIHLYKTEHGLSDTLVQALIESYGMYARTNPSEARAALGSALPDSSSANRQWWEVQLEPRKAAVSSNVRSVCEHAVSAL